MSTLVIPKYEVELYSRGGVLIADISRYVKNLSFTLQRNQAEQLSFSIDLDAFEAQAQDIGTNPLSMLGPYQTDVKVKRNGTYLFGAHVGTLDITLAEIENTLNIRAFGYLNLLIDRYVSPTPYVQVDAVDIAWDLIDLTQSQTNGDMGITQGGQQATTVSRDRTYEPRQNAKDGIVNLTKLVDGNFDIEFTHERVFNTYTMIGTDRSASLEFVYPGNIREVSVPRDGLALFNKIYGIGSGFGQDSLTSTPSDNDSQLNYGVHEKIITFNSVTEQTTLDQNTQGELNQRKSLLEIPQMTVSGEDFDLNSYGVGDRVTVRIENYPFLATVTGIYRIEKIEVSVDEDEAEDIKLYFDNFGVEQ